MRCKVKKFLMFLVILFIIPSISAFSVWSYYESFGNWITGRSVDLADSQNPDLIVSNVAIRPDSPATGDWVLLDVEVSNGGNKDADNALVTYYYDGKEIGEENLGTIKISSTKPSSLKWQVNKEGTHTFKVAIDSENTILESNEYNNYKEKRVYVLWSAETSCIDSDTGIDYYTAGRVTSNIYEEYGGYEDDICIGKYQLLEYYCEGNKPLSEGYYCQYGCAEGACIKSRNVDLRVLNIKFEPENILVGKVVKIVAQLEIDDPSSVYGKTFETVFHYHDADLGWITIGNPSYTIKREPGTSRPTVSVEWIPEEAINYTIKATVDIGQDIEESNEKNNNLSIIVPVSGEGACIESDGGKNIYQKGTISTVKETLTDVCQGNVIVEYYCENGEIKRQSERCKVDCIDGACVREEKEVIPPPEEKTPEEVKGCSDEEKLPVVPEVVVQCEGCSRKGDCIPILGRAESEYCDEYGFMRSQKADYNSCYYNSECASNYCYKEKCVKKGSMGKFKLWIKMLFG